MLVRPAMNLKRLVTKPNMMMFNKQARLMSFASTNSLVNLHTYSNAQNNFNAEAFHHLDVFDLCPTSNVLYINSDFGCKPAFQLRINNQIKEQDLDNSTTLADVKSWVLREFQSLASIQDVSFFSPDGT